MATSKQRSMSVTVNPRVEYIDRASDGNSHGSGKDMEKPLISGGDKRSTFQRSSSLQVLELPTWVSPFVSLST